MTHDDIYKDPWLNVLAGTAQPHDPDTRKAAALRDFFKLQEQHTPPLDTATQRRIMNRLAARGAFTQVTPVVPVSLMARMGEWLFPQGHGGRWSAVAAAVMALTVLPFVVWHGRDDDPYTVKSLSIPADTPAPAAAVIDTDNPQQLAAQLVATLARHGVTAQHRSDGTHTWVSAHIAPDQQSAVQSDLDSLGVSIPAGGQLEVQFRHQP